MALAFRYQTTTGEVVTIPNLKDVRFIGSAFVLCIFTDESTAGIRLDNVTQFSTFPETTQQTGIAVPETKIIVP